MTGGANDLSLRNYQRRMAIQPLHWQLVKEKATVSAVAHLAAEVMAEATLRSTDGNIRRWNTSHSVYSNNN